MGKGGIGGTGTFNGNLRKVQFEIYTERWLSIRTQKQYRFEILLDEPGEKIPAGKSGRHGFNSVGIEQPRSIKPINPSFTVNEYKKFVREQLVNNLRESNLKTFVMDLYEGQRIQSLYDTLGAIDELQGIESQYFLSRDKVSFFPFVKSLLRRIKEYAKTHSKSTEEMNVLNYLYAATFQKYLAIRSNFTQISTIDLPEHLDSVRAYIDKLRGFKRDAFYESQHDSKVSLNEKINTTKMFIKTHFTQEIENITIVTENQIFRMLNLSANDENERIQLKHAMAIHRAMNPIKIVTSLLLIIADPNVEEITKNISILYGFGNENFRNTSQSFTAPKSSTKEIGRYFIKEYQLFSEQLKDIDMKFTEFMKVQKSAEFLEIILEINLMKKEVDAAIGQMRIGLKNILIKMESKLDERDSNFHEKIELIRRVKAIIQLNYITIEAYNRIRGDDAKIHEINQVIDKMQNMNRKQYEDSFYNEIIPKLCEIEAILNTDRDHGIGLRKVQNKLKDVKSFLQKRMKELEIPSRHYIEKLDELMAILITIYDRIGSYSYSETFAALLRKITTISFSEKYNKSIISLNQIIQSNLVLEKYEMAMYSFKEHQFPFALQLAKFDLPADLQFNNTEILIEKIIDHIEYLKEQVQLSKISIGKYDREIFKDIEFNSSTTPFFIWKSHDFKNEIEKLFSGEEIVIKADILNGIEQNAVKFNEIGIHIKSSNENTQIELNAELESFNVTMTMIGNSYYRCGARFYSIPVDSITIEYSMDKNQDGKTKSLNENSRTIKNEDYFLGPYAMWSIKLTHQNNDFKKLTKFQYQSIDLELIGRGQYFKDHGLYASEICSSHLDKYYHFDKKYSYADNMRLTEWFKIK